MNIANYTYPARHAIPGTISTSKFSSHILTPEYQHKMHEYEFLKAEIESLLLEISLAT